MNQQEPSSNAAASLVTADNPKCHHVTVLVVQNRISARRAAVLTYITNQLLHSLVAIKREVDSQPVEWDWTGWPERNDTLAHTSQPDVSPA